MLKAAIADKDISAKKKPRLLLHRGFERYLLVASS